MPRSGTSLLQRLCDRHPQMRVSNDFGNYAFVGDSFPVYMARAAKRVIEINGRARVIGPFAGRTRNYISNLHIMFVHLIRVGRHGAGPVTLSVIAKEARKNDLETYVVGDKFPQYIFRMDRFVELPELLRLVIYRDCRDVTSSFLGMVRTRWRHRPWVRELNTAERIALLWVRAIEIMERRFQHVFAMRYEDLVGDPESELRRLAGWLGVDPAGFEARAVSDSSVGKYREGLTARELDDVLRVAGPALERLNYTKD